jgi:competence protein ComEC
MSEVYRFGCTRNGRYRGCGVALSVVAGISPTRYSGVYPRSRRPHGRVGCGAGELSPRELWLGVNSPNPELQTLLREAKALMIPVLLHKAGDNVEMGGTKFAVLAPPRDADPSRPNDKSLVIKISYGATSVLFEGDAEKKTEQQVARESPQADLLKSGPPWQRDFYDPGTAGRGSSTVRGQISGRREVLEWLEEAHVITYRTDMDGAVTFYLDGKTVTSQLAAPH